MRRPCRVLCDGFSPPFVLLYSNSGCARRCFFTSVRVTGEFNAYWVKCFSRDQERSPREWDYRDWKSTVSIFRSKFCNTWVCCFQRKVLEEAGCFASAHLRLSHVEKTVGFREDRDMADRSRVKQGQASDAGGEGTRKVRVTSGGRQPLQLQKSNVMVTGVRAFLRAHELYKQGIECSKWM